MLTDDGKIFSNAKNDISGLLSIIQLTNGAILAGTNDHSIYKLTDEGTIDTSVGGGTGKLEDPTFDSLIHSIFQLANVTVLAGSGTSIYKLTDEGKIDTSVGNGTVN
ncbi:hypothetical protein [Spiroplasma endosymbiont of Labia minor]|uniref:hypothetical protein n=1 Tax=Spiroplasma endosymbiont of Labia minor TaxID=3066305 RepID=UPI0030D1C821